MSIASLNRIPMALSREFDTDLAWNSSAAPHLRVRIYLRQRSFLPYVTKTQSALCHSVCVSKIYWEGI